MFYTIQKVNDHPCYNMQRILKTFFNQLSQGNVWNLDNQDETLKRVHGRSNFVPNLERLYNEILSRNEIVRLSICKQFENNNEIEKLCKNTLDLLNYIKWEESTGKKIKEFFLDCYPEKLDLGIFKSPSCTTSPTKEFYQKFITLNGHICPFCSILSHKHPFGRKRGDFDHYLDKAHYPMAALNIDNLIPMCSECNQDYKHTDDILKEDNGSRRAFIYPYSLEEAFNIEVLEIVFEDGNWKFNLNITSSLGTNIVTSFDSVFNIKERMQRELSKRYDSWLMEEVKRYVLSSTGVNNVIGFKKSLLNTAENIIDLEDRVLETKLLEHALYLYLANTTDTEINDIFLNSYLFDYLE